MKISRPFGVIAIALLFSVVALPGPVLAADPIISGRITDPNGVPVSGASVSSAQAAASAVTDANGFFSITVAYGSTGSVYCSAGWTYTPASYSFSNITSDVSGLTFVVNVPLVTISGRLTDTNGKPIVSMRMWGGNTNLSPVTAIDGTYAISAQSGTSGSVRPRVYIRTYTPSQVEYSNIRQNAEGVDFTTTPNLEVGPEACNIWGSNTLKYVVRDVGDGEELILRPGTYPSSLDFQGKAITVRSTDPQDPSIVAATKIDGENTRRCVLFAGTEGRDSILDGLTLQRGYYRDYATGATTGIHCGAASPTIRNCQLRDFDASIVRSEGGSPLISHCMFINNTERLFALYDSDVIVENCTMSHNAFDCDMVYTTNASMPTFRNCLIAENDFFIAVFRLDDGAVTSLANCTVVNNRCITSPAYSVGVFDNAGAALVITNSIISNPLPTDVHLFSRGTGVSVAYSDCPSPPAGAIYGPDNMNIDPQFAIQGSSGGDAWVNVPDTPVDESANNVYGDYHLRSTAGRFSPALGRWVRDESATSPCIDAGDPNASWAGETWPNGSRLDMGAYGGTPEASITPCPELAAVDLYPDRIINGFDLLVLADSWLSTDPTPADLSGDGIVNFADYLRFANAYMFQ